MVTIRTGPGFFRCSLPRDPATMAVIRNLQEHGLLAADHSVRRGDREVVAVSDAEVQILKKTGVAFDILGRVAHHDSDVTGQGIAVNTSGGAAADALATGFVTAYLDAPRIAAGAGEFLLNWSIRRGLLRAKEGRWRLTVGGRSPSAPAVTTWGRAPCNLRLVTR